MSTGTEQLAPERARIFRPLPADHPLIDGDRCPLCRKTFSEGERVMLVPARVPQSGVETVPANVVHATCALLGAKTPVGTVARIKDGDGSPFAVITDKGQFTIEEAGYSE